MSEFRNQIRTQMLTGRYSEKSTQRLPAKEYLRQHSQCSEFKKRKEDVKKPRVSITALFSIFIATFAICGLGALLLNKEALAEGFMMLGFAVGYCFFKLVTLKKEIPTVAPYISPQQYYQSLAHKRQSERIARVRKRFKAPVRTDQNTQSTARSADYFDDDSETIATNDAYFYDQNDEDDSYTNPVLREIYYTSSNLHYAAICTNSNNSAIDDNIWMDCTDFDSTLDDISNTDHWI